MTNETPAPRSTWLITGSSSGLGQALASAVLATGRNVVLAARNTSAMQSLAQQYPATTLVVALDVTRADQVARAVAETEARFGALDVLVNNAGVGFIGAVEEGDAEAVRQLFEVNFFGAAAMTRAALPGMRQRGHGAIVNISSTAGGVGFAGLGYYAASKFALEGLTEALQQEVEPHGIRVRLIQPGGFRTGNVARSTFSKVNGAYAATAGAFRDWVLTLRDSDVLGDPARAARAIIAAVLSESPALRVVLGPDAHAALTAKANALLVEYEAGKAVALGTNFQDTP